MIRNILGSIVALAGAAAAVLSPFRDWYDGRLGRNYRVADLVNGISADSNVITGVRPGLWGSIWLPLLFGAAVTVVGVLLRSRLLVAFAGVVVLGFTVLWMVRQGQATGSLTVASDGTGLQTGVAYAAGGAALMLLGAVLMPGRRAGGSRLRRGDRNRPYAAPGSAEPDTWPPTQEPGPSVQTSPWPEPEADPYTGPGPSRADQDTATYPVQDEGPEGRRPPRP
ncbi:hypothetical protein LRD69_18790 [Streptomyces sp. JH14]|uniref:hypothetical protein n=1 Tax=Streptomyces sp. JH14 TaxID=2793630 RepID=UPI0023F873EC|nr:hypothetical protein [Streptomyces sp. JH14]MDF6044146.1 hypothetical protein [Streptomyces sp. JH14]